MVDTKSVKQSVKNWREGLERTKAVPCPECKKLTRAYSECQLCGVKWTMKQIEERDNRWESQSRRYHK